jgi:hypothetical protein
VPKQHGKESKIFQPRATKTQPTTGETQQKGCACCGGNHQWGWRFCPARDVKCSNCQIQGHYARCCFKNIKEMVLTANPENPEDSDSDENYYTLAIVGALVEQSTGDSAWRANIEVGGPANIINFKLDSGSDVTAITMEEGEKLQPQPKFKAAQRDLRGPDRAKLQVLHVFKARLAIKEHETPELVYVVDGLQVNLLSRG